MSIKRNGSEFIELFALKAGIGSTEAKLFIHALSETVTEVAISEGKSSLSGFGRFTIKEVADREGTQPGTGERIIIPAHKRIYFDRKELTHERPHFSGFHWISLDFTAERALALPETRWIVILFQIIVASVP